MLFGSCQACHIRNKVFHAQGGRFHTQGGRFHACTLRSTHAPKGQKLPAQGKRAKRCDTLGFAACRPIRPNGAKAATGAFSCVYPAFNARPEGAKAPSPGQASEAMRHPGFRGVPSDTPQRGKSSDRGVFMRVPCVQRTPRRGKSSQPRASERSDATPWVSRRAVRYAPTGQKQRQGRSKLPGGRGGGRKTGPPPWSAGITGAAGMVGGRLWGEGARGGSGKMRREGAGHYHSSAGRYHSSPNDFSSPNCTP